MLRAINSFFEIKTPNDIGEKVFLLGLFFLPAALPFAGIFFLISLLISFKYNKIQILKSKRDLSLLIALILIFISSINNTIINIPKELVDQNIFNVWISLFNWVPLFFFYWGFEPFLKTGKQRIKTLKFLISGSIPVLISCILQKLSFHGPYKTFYGLIVWFNKPFDQIGGTTGLFSNPNYTGIFLTLILPFLFFLIKNLEENNLIKKFILLIIIFFTIFFAISTNSRNALIGLIISLLTFTNINKISSYLLIGFGGFFLFINYLSNIFSFLKNIFISNIMSICYGQESLILFCKLIIFDEGLSNSRVRIWLSALSIIKERPIWGWGSSTFIKVLPLKNIVAIPYPNLNSQHSHNIILEIAHNFGIPVAFVLSISILSLFITAFRIIMNSHTNNIMNNNLNKAWLFSLLIVLVSQLFDITYYDGRISLILAILLSGIRCIIKENSNLKINFY